jgi:uncharacterized protein (DUF362 family)
MQLLDAVKVALVKEAPRYAGNPPYHPSERFPEWPGGPGQDQDNPAYRAVRHALLTLDLDSPNYNTPRWNPLRSLISPGNTVVLKPNLVSHRNLFDRHGLTDTDSLVTHGSVIRAVTDYVAKALCNNGRIIIGDCPIQGTIWNEVVRLTGLAAVTDHVRHAFPGIEIVLKDYRLATARVSGGKVIQRLADEGSLDAYYEVDLKGHSLLIPLMDGKCQFGVSQYAKHRMLQAHTPTTNKYLFPKEIMQADVVINLPKLKTHMKAGVSISLKNLVGINGHKDYLPHFRFGSPKTGGDEYPGSEWLPTMANWLAHMEWEYDQGLTKLALVYAAGACGVLQRKLAGRTPLDGFLSGGSWYGNDTLWRTVLDINRAFFYFDPKREEVVPEAMCDRKYMTIVDGLVVGEKESPLAPSPRPCGLMLAGFNPVAVDSVGAAMLGFDIHKIPYIHHAFRSQDLPLAHFAEDDIEVRGFPGANSLRDIYSKKLFYRCRPSRGMLGHIEYDDETAPLTEADGRRTALNYDAL